MSSFIFEHLLKRRNVFNDTRHCGNRTRKIMQMRKNESTRIFRAQMQLSRSLRCHSQSSSATFLSLAFGFWHKGKNVLTLFHTSMTKMFQFYTHAKATSLQDRPQIPDLDSRYPILLFVHFGILMVGEGISWILMHRLHSTKESLTKCMVYKMQKWKGVEIATLW